jgi:hypothetical protein
MCDTSLDSGIRADHFDASLDHLSQVVFEIFDLMFPIDIMHMYIISMQVFLGFSVVLAIV